MKKPFVARTYEAVHDPDEHDRIRGLWVSAAGHFTSSIISKSAVSRDYYAFMFCSKAGKGTFKVPIGGKTVNVKEGDVYIRPANVPYAHVCTAEGWKFWWIHYAGPQAVRLTKWLGFSVANLVAHGGEIKRFEKAFSNIYKLLNRKPRNYQQDAVTWLCGLFLDIHKVMHSPGKSSRS